MLHDFEVVTTGGFAVVTIMLWSIFIGMAAYYIYQSRPMRPVRKFIRSLLVLVQPRKSRHMYHHLFVNGYIYKWSMDICMRKWRAE